MRYKFLGSERKGGYSVVVVRILAGKALLSFWDKGGGGKKEICREYKGRVWILELESCLPFQEVLNKSSKPLRGDLNLH